MRKQCPGDRWQYFGIFRKIISWFLVFLTVSMVSIFQDSDNLSNVCFSRADEQKSMIEAEVLGTENQPEIYVYNRYYGPVEIEFILTRAVNIISSPVLPARFVIPQAGRIKTFTLRPSMPQASFSYAYEYRFTFGDPKAEHRPPKPYRPPFPNGNRFRISRSFQDNSGSDDNYNAFAVNILMSKGVPVCVSRKGVVMDIAMETFTKKTSAGIIKGQTYLVRLLHDDGTMGVYAHLKPGSVSVSTGMQLEEKQVIGEPGVSDDIDMPHLYFAVQKNSSMKLESIPFEFEDPQSAKGIPPFRGMVLRTD
ncbi:Peptidase M23 domain-containing protein [Desulfonema limicola]|uniref:Peptidase M23 domain-containing protein n=1 Tax=Desulfonema limicola TaxID=45656 RepID=A0A975BD84_9BACT|nr:peptidoglycan DD-metalloendopeptidase family protein [Desulfonema limicola]QTA83377.1 Peptidase M23 domain-containing protein [Desulfonema limicola]